MYPIKKFAYVCVYVYAIYMFIFLYFYLILKSLLKFTLSSLIEQLHFWDILNWLK